MSERHESRVQPPSPDTELSSSTSNTNEHDDYDPSLQRISSRVLRPTSLSAEALFVAVLCSAQLMTQVGLALGVVPQHAIARSLAVPADQPAQLSWFSAAYSLTVGTFILPAGRLGDVFGHRRFFIAGFAWYGLWSLIAGLAVYSGGSSAGGPVLFDFCRAMQGIGPAFLLPNSIAILGRAYEPGRRQDMVFSLFGATAPSGFVVGAVFSSLLAERVWWPWAYWVMCFACLALAALGRLAIPPTPVPKYEAEGGGDSIVSIWQRTDALGSAVGVSALVLFNFAWNQGPVVGWTVPYTYALMLVGIALFVAFVLIEKRASHPLIPFGVLKMESFFTLACITAGWSSFGIFVFYQWNFLQVLRSQSALLTAAQFSTVSPSGLAAALTTGWVLSHVRPSLVMLIALLAFTVGGAVIATTPVGQTYWAQTFVGLLVLPWGMDMSFPAATILLSRAMPRRHQGLAASLVNTFVNYSISIGLGFGATVERYVNDGGRDVLAGYRGAWYMGVGLAGLGVGMAVVFCLVDGRRARKSMAEPGSESGSGDVADDVASNVAK